MWRSSVPQPPNGPAGFHYLSTSKMAGLHYWAKIDAKGNMELAVTGDVEHVLDRNTAMRNHNDGWSNDGRAKSDKLMQRVASVPWGVIHLWREQLGVDYFSNDPDQQRAVNRLLNDSDWSKLRTGGGRL